MGLLASTVVYALLLGVAVTGVEIPRVSKLRHFGPYGHAEQPTRASDNSNIDLPLLVHNQQSNTQSFVPNNSNNQENKIIGFIVQNPYDNDKMSSVNQHTNNGNENGVSHQQFDGYNSATSFGSANSFNEFDFDSIKAQLINYVGNGNRESFDRFIGQRPQQGPPEEFTWLTESQKPSELDWSATRKDSYKISEDDGGLGRDWGREVGRQGLEQKSNFKSKLSIDTYSIFALIIFKAFLAYIIYHYTTTSNKKKPPPPMPRPAGRRAQLDLTGIMDDVISAFERWAVFEYLPNNFSEPNDLQLQIPK